MRCQSAAINTRSAAPIRNITLEVTNAVHILEETKLTMEAAKIAVTLAKESFMPMNENTNWRRAVFFVLDAQTQLAQSRAKSHPGPG